LSFRPYDILLGFGAGELLLRLPLRWGSVLGLVLFGCRGSAGADVFAMDFFGAMKILLTSSFGIFRNHLFRLLKSF
jgi:hypothetical protein